MSNLNMCCISGNLTRDPELKVTPGGMQVLHFSVACNESHKMQDGSWEDVPNFFDCVCFGSRADALSNILRKGMKVTVGGKLKWSSWEKDGQKRSKVEIIADAIELPPRANGTGATQSAQNYQGGYTYAQPTYSAPNAATAPAAPTPAEYDADIPF